MAQERRDRRGEPGAHWILLLLGALVLLAELSLNGFIQHVGAEGYGAQAPAADIGAAPAGYTGGGPVLRVASADSITSRAMPAGTVALTFDDGPDPQWTPQILDVLARHHAHATFFVIGSRVNEYPQLVRRILAEGHEIGVHSFTHAQLELVPAWRRRLELSLSRSAIAGAAGIEPTLMRPPYSSEPGALTAVDVPSLVAAGAAGYLVVLADRDPQDWRRPGVAAIVSAAMPAAGGGAVVMLHDGGGDRAQTVAAVDQLLTALDSRKYRAITVSDGLGLQAEPAASPSQRWRGDSLRWAQLVGAWLAKAMNLLLTAALTLSILRIAVQLWTSRRHIRAIARRQARPLAYLGPVTVIVPAYNEAANIANTVRSLVANDYPSIEVIVVDDGSTDDTAGIVSRLRLPGVRVIRQANAGKPAALNTGIRASSNELLILVDGDTVFDPTAVGVLLQSFTDPTVAAVSGNTKVANRGGLIGRWQHLEYVMGFNLDRRMFEVGECMPTVPGAIGAFRRRALTDVGLVPADTLAEDTDLTMAILRAGWRVVYEERAIAWTEAPASLRQLWRQRYRWCYGTMQAMWKHRRALVERGSAGRFGRRGLAYLTIFQVALPLCAPAIDVYAIYGLAFLPLPQTAVVWLGFVALQLLLAAYALRLDRESLGPLWSLPLQQLVYRQLMYLVVIQSTVTAITGMRLKWHRIARTGQATPAPRTSTGVN